MDVRDDAGRLTAQSEPVELEDAELEGISGGADGGVTRPCPCCGQELKWTRLVLEFVCFNLKCPDYIFKDKDEVNGYC